MALTNDLPNTILLDVHSSANLLEGIVGAGETIHPGQLVQVDMINAGKIIRFDFANFALAPALVAIENMAEGKSVADAYVADEKIYYMQLRAGDLFWGRSVAAAVELGQPLGGQDLTGQLIATSGYIAATAPGNYNEAIVIVAQADALTTANRLIKVSVK